MPPPLVPAPDGPQAAFSELNRRVAGEMAFPPHLVPGTNLPAADYPDTVLAHLRTQAKLSAGRAPDPGPYASVEAELANVSPTAPRRRQRKRAYLSAVRLGRPRAVGGRNFGADDVLVVLPDGTCLHLAREEFSYYYDRGGDTGPTARQALRDRRLRDRMPSPGDGLIDGSGI